MNKKIGILGAGQLGKMLCLEAARLDLDLSLMDKNDRFPAAKLCKRFVAGDFKNYEDVLNFGRTVDILSIEIEAVNVDALKQLKSEGISVHPDPDQLEIIKDKGLQKQFYKKHQIPTSPFTLYEDAEEIRKAVAQSSLRLPFVQKARKDGYDGRGVHVVRKEADLEKLLDTASLVEPLVDIEKEIAVIVARNENDEVKAYPAVEMEFHPTANLVEFLFCPSEISEMEESIAQKLARDLIRAFDICGLLAVEMFLTKQGKILINEVAPRPHNSGHHTLDSAKTSQFEQHLRAITNLPLGSCENISPAVMINLLGEDSYAGPVKYEHLEEMLQVNGLKILLYGKTETRPFRKMGHATILDASLERAKEKARKAKSILKIISV